MTYITTLIPAYKKDFLGELFLGLCSQTFRDFRVVLSDDSPGAEITRLIRDGHYAALTGRLDLSVVRGPQNARLNHQRLLELWDRATPLVHFNLDDDIIYPDFYRAHVAAHADCALAVSVSRRWLSGSDGRPTMELPIPAAVEQRNERVLRLSAAELCTSILPGNANWLGELSNMVMSIEGARHYPTPPAQGLNYYGLLDLGMVLEAAGHAPVAYLPDHLSVFRQNPQQTTHNVHSHGGHIMFLSWVAYALVAWQQGHLSPPQAAQAIDTATRRIVQQFGDTDPVMNEYLTLLEHHRTGLDGLHTKFGSFWRHLMASQSATDPASYARPAERAAA